MIAEKVYIDDLKSLKEYNSCITIRNTGGSMISLRLTEDVERQLNILTEVENQTKTDIIRAAICEYYDRHVAMLSSYQLGHELFGRTGSDEVDLSENYKQRMKERLNAKYSD
ncbi:MAG: ribbon-helix-helix protein, CopG family [Spirochaetales bacterium]|nr:ribbon-helix-helix protein, CopG family [Spirochaetales bacterium]